MIPKTIHYCWFGKKRKPELMEECIRSWRDNLPDYEIICWNEKNSPVNHPFVRAALREKYFAFAADYVRLYVLQQYGGIYLDTDVMVVKNFDDLINYDLFIGEELPGRINLAILGATPGHPLINRFIQFYNENKFNSSHLPIISTCLTEVFNNVKYELIGANDKVFTPPAFYPLPYDKRSDNYKNYIADDTITVHLWNHSWRTAVDYIYEKKYIPAFSKILHHVLHNRSDRFSIKYYKNLYQHLRTSLQ